jgi:HD-GYP domain-containing protein (c-di-GMP phosphodiesterase class II)
VHRIDIAKLRPGDVLGRALYTSGGRILLAAGAKITERYISAISDRGFEKVYIRDGIADDVVPEDVVSDHLRQSAVQTVKKIYELMTAATQPVRDAAAKHGAHALCETPLQEEPKLIEHVQNLYVAAEAILNEVMEDDSIGSLASLKSHDNYTFQHSVDVAINGAILGKRLHLHPSVLRDLTLGCLLHDIGKQYIDVRILNKPGRLTDAEFAHIMQHPELGFQLLSQMPMEGSRARHIVLQHHERQDGSGYPKKLFGGNRILRTDQERFDRRRINLASEVCSVADVYSALVSDRPYRAAMTAPEIVNILRAESGGHLNTEIVQAFVSLVQLFPVASLARIQGGRYNGSVGIVVKVNILNMDRPVVRLLFDTNGHRYPDDAEVELLAEWGAQLVPIAESELPADSHVTKLHRMFTRSLSEGASESETVARTLA